MIQQAEFDFEKEAIIWDEVETKPVDTSKLQAAWWELWNKNKLEGKENGNIQRT